MLHRIAVSESEDSLSRLYRAIGDTTRRRIIDELSARGNQSLFEIYTRVQSRYGINQTRQAFTRHLLVLEEVGVIEVEWRGNTKLHSVNTQPLARLPEGWLANFRMQP
jgi:DNA-binding transcriptional ArsR family regulator